MNPTLSYANIHSSIEKFLWDNIASTEPLLLINQDDLVERLPELEATNKALVWRILGGSTGNKSSLSLFSGITTIKDPGSIIQRTLFDKVKALFEEHASIPVYDYTGAVAGEKVNELAFVGNLQVWPLVREPNGFKTLLLSRKLLFGQRVV